MKLRIVPSIMLQNNNGVMQLSQQKSLCQMKASILIVGATILLPAKKHVSAHRAFNPSFESTALVKKHDANPTFSTRRQEGGAATHMPEEDDSFKHVKRDTHHLLPVNAY